MPIMVVRINFLATIFKIGGQKMSQISITNLTFSYEGSSDVVFNNVSFSMDTDWRLGFTGRNGRGKTTFLNLLLDKHEYSGKISKTVEMAYFPYQVKDMTQSTIDVITQVYPSFKHWELLKEFYTLKLSEDILYRPFKTLSNGEQTKVLLAILFLKENTFLLIDEPTNHLDRLGRDTVSAYLQKKKGFILVSHDREFLDKTIDHILSINKTNIEIQRGNFSSWYNNKYLQDSFEIAENDKLKKEIKRLETTSKEKKTWSNRTEVSKFGGGDGMVDRGYIGHKAAKMMKRAKSIQQRADKNIVAKQKLLKNIESAEELKLEPTSYHAKTLIRFENVTAFYDKIAVIKNINFEINQGDCISLQGINGSGKSTVLKLILGDEITHNGTITKPTDLKISYIPQDTSFLCGTLTDYAIACQIDETLFKSILIKLDFSRQQFNKDMLVFSEGQKKKVLIAKSLCEKAHVYIWDEPLNFIDVLSRIQIENLLETYRPTILFVEHDKLFAEKISNKAIMLA